MLKLMPLIFNPIVRVNSFHLNACADAFEQIGRRLYYFDEAYEMLACFGVHSHKAERVHPLLCMPSNEVSLLGDAYDALCVTMLSLDSSLNSLPSETTARLDLQRFIVQAVSDIVKLNGEEGGLFTQNNWQTLKERLKSNVEPTLLSLHHDCLSLWPLFRSPKGKPMFDCSQDAVRVYEDLADGVFALFQSLEDCELACRFLESSKHDRPVITWAGSTQSWETYMSDAGNCLLANIGLDLNDKDMRHVISRLHGFSCYSELKEKLDSSLRRKRLYVQPAALILAEKISDSPLSRLAVESMGEESSVLLESIYFAIWTIAGYSTIDFDEDALEMFVEAVNTLSVNIKMLAFELSFMDGHTKNMALAILEASRGVDVHMLINSFKHEIIRGFNSDMLKLA